MSLRAIHRRLRYRTAVRCARGATWALALAGLVAALGDVTTRAGEAIEITAADIAAQAEVQSDGNGLFTDADVAPGLLRPVSSQPIAQPRVASPPVVAAQPPAVLPPPPMQYPSTETLPELEPVPPITLTPLGQLTTNVAPPTGEMPHNYAADARRDPTVMIGDPAEPIVTSAPFYSTPRTPNFVNRPLYFEERRAERDGHSWGAAQPFVSAAHFFGTFPVLPYKMGAQPPFMRLNTGNGINVPSDHYTLRQHIRGAAAQTGATLGLIFVIP